jgi:hypothetical protein
MRTCLFLLLGLLLASCAPSADQVQKAIFETQTAAPVQAFTSTASPTLASTPLPSEAPAAAPTASPTQSEAASPTASTTAPPPAATDLAPSKTPDASGILTYIDGYGGDVFTAEDNMLLQDPAEINLATHDVYDVSPTRRFIQRFNLSAIPAGSTVISARVYYYKTNAVPNGVVTCSIYSISKANGDWPEGTKYNRPAQAGDSSWNFKDASGIPWAGSPGLSTSGVDYEPAPIGTLIIPARAQVGDEFVAELDPRRVEGWLGSPNTNYGILLIANAKADYIGAAENPVPEYRPKLVVQYRLP